ncbi:hypothetical protein AB1Y20_013322 [Prymnesium parvum]|uniref:Uncharacterized protein n=1 Tax=Prymnesium parvum TaxID=97485 RepID=A0AB34IN35_PRYPA
MPLVALLVRAVLATGTAQDAPLHPLSAAAKAHVSKRYAEEASQVSYNSGKETLLAMLDSADALVQQPWTVMTRAFEAVGQGKPLVMALETGCPAGGIRLAAAALCSDQLQVQPSGNVLRRCQRSESRDSYVRDAPPCGTDEIQECRTFKNKTDCACLPSIRTFDWQVSRRRITEDNEFDSHYEIRNDTAFAAASVASRVCNRHTGVCPAVLHLPGQNFAGPKYVYNKVS